MSVINILSFFHELSVYIVFMIWAGSFYSNPKVDVPNKLNPLLLKVGVMLTALGITVTAQKSGSLTPQEAVGLIGQNSYPLILSLFLQIVSPFISSKVVTHLLKDKVGEDKKELEVEDFYNILHSINNSINKTNSENLVLSKMNYNLESILEELIEIKTQNQNIFSNMAKQNTDSLMQAIQGLLDTIADKVNNEIKDTVVELKNSCNKMIETTGQFSENMGSYNSILEQNNKQISDFGNIVSQTNNTISDLNNTTKEVTSSSMKMNFAFSSISANSSAVVAAAKQISDSTSMMQKDAREYIEKIGEISQDHMKKYGNVNSQILDHIFRTVESKNNK